MYTTLITDLKLYKLQIIIQCAAPKSRSSIGISTEPSAVCDSYYKLHDNDNNPSKWNELHKSLVILTTSVSL